MKIQVDRVVYSTKKEALDEMFMAMIYCDGSEAERMAFAYSAIYGGATYVNTYDGKAWTGYGNKTRRII